MEGGIPIVTAAGDALSAQHPITLADTGRRFVSVPLTQGHHQQGG